MKLIKNGLLLAFTMMACSMSSLFADTSPANKQENEEVDLASIRRYLENRDVSIKQKGGNLRLGGDVRVDYKRNHQRLDGKTVEGRGRGGSRDLYVAPYKAEDPKPGKSERNIPKNFGNVEASLSFDYTNNKSFAKVLLKFNNHMGLDTTNFEDKDDLSSTESRLGYKSAYAPTNNRIQLARAVVGYKAWDQDGHNVEVNLGRQRLYDLFDSRVMFVNRFDGVALKYKSDFEGVGRFHATYGGFIISDRVNHFGHAAELGLCDILDSSVDVKYNFIKWNKGGVYSDGSHGGVSDDQTKNNSPLVNGNYQYFHKAFRFNISQLQASYTVPDEWSAGQPLKVYAAFLYNHLARGMKDDYINQERDRKNNTGWYAGFTLGRITMPGDCVFDMNYQYVGAQAVPDFDSYGGAGRGNLTNVWGVLDRSQGNTNYKGVRAQLAYAATADILINLKAIHTDAAQKRLCSANNLRDAIMRKEGKSAPTRLARNRWDYVEVELVYSF